MAIISSKNIDFNYEVLLNQTSTAIRSANLVLTKSGTVTLEVALCKKPMVISYKVAKLTAWIVRRKIKIKYVGQPNILLNEEVVKELLQEDATSDNLATHMLDLYYNNEKQEYIVKKFYELHHMLKSNVNNALASAILTAI